jgi:tetratricopeptide (TPR) repeat protein
LEEVFSNARRLEEALILVRRFVDLADESGAPARGRAFVLQLLVAPALYLGRANIWLTASEELAGAGIGIGTSARALCLVQLGRLEEARAVAGPLLDDVESRIDEFRIQVLVMLLQAAVAVVEHRAASQSVGARLAGVAHVTGEMGVHTCIARHLGDAVALAGDVTAARAYYEQALGVAGKIRFRPEVALAHLRLAELTLEDGDESAAAEHLDLAIPELQEMHMQPALERAQALSGDLHRRSEAPTPARSTASETGVGNADRSRARDR